MIFVTLYNAEGNMVLHADYGIDMARDENGFRRKDRIARLVKILEEDPYIKSLEAQLVRGGKTVISRVP